MTYPNVDSHGFAPQLRDGLPVAWCIICGYTWVHDLPADQVPPCEPKFKPTGILAWAREVDELDRMWKA